MAGYRISGECLANPSIFLDFRQMSPEKIYAEIVLVTSISFALPGTMFGKDCDNLT
jgi:hypothetical protein